MRAGGERPQGDPAKATFLIGGTGVLNGTLVVMWDGPGAPTGLIAFVEAGCEDADCTGRSEAAGQSPLSLAFEFARADWINVTVREGYDGAGTQDVGAWVGASNVEQVHVAGVLVRRDAAPQSLAFAAAGGQLTPDDQNCEDGTRPPTGSPIGVFDVAASGALVDVDQLHVRAVHAGPDALPCFQVWGPDGRLLWSLQGSGQVLLSGPLPLGDYTAYYYGAGPSTHGNVDVTAFLGGSA